jgi:phytoene dehydrogenase-like protein
LGLKNISLKDYGLGNFNIWYNPTEDIDYGFKIPLYDLDYKRSFLFISSPSAHIDPNSIAQTMQIVAPANYQLVENIYKHSISAHENLKENIKNHILETLAKKFIPDIRKYIEVAEIWSPIDLAEKVKAPFGTIYGMRPNKRKIIFPVGQKSPFENLYFVGATATNPGLSFVLQSALKLFDNLHKTKDFFT